MFRIVCASIVIASAVSLGRPAAATTDDCRYEGWSRADDTHDGTSRDTFLPNDDVFRSPLADPKEARFYASLQRARFRSGPVTRSHDDDVIYQGLVAGGASVGLWTRRAADGCDGVQIGALGVVLSQFDLDRSSGDLINTDYLVGVPLSARRARWSGRARLMHQSSHVGDEFLVRNRGFRVRNFGFEFVDFMLAYDFDRVRLYGGAGAVFNSSSSFAPGILQAGAEVRLPGTITRRLLTLSATPVFGVDFKSLEEQDWAGSWNAVAGIELSRSGSTRKLRLLGTGSAGQYPYAQFFAETRSDSLGVMLQFEL